MARRFSETSSSAEGAADYKNISVLVDNHGHTETHLCDGSEVPGIAVSLDTPVPPGFLTYKQP